jgi:hypothetical protein
MKTINRFSRLGAVTCLAAAMAFGASSTASLKAGKAELKSAGPLHSTGRRAFRGRFGGGDDRGARFGRPTPARAGAKIEVKAINQKIAALLGTARTRFW